MKTIIATVLIAGLMAGCGKKDKGGSKEAGPGPGGSGQEVSVNYAPKSLGAAKVEVDDAAALASFGVTGSGGLKLTADKPDGGFKKITQSGELKSALTGEIINESTEVEKFIPLEGGKVVLNFKASATLAFPISDAAKAKYDTEQRPRVEAELAELNTLIRGNNACEPNEKTGGTMGDCASLEKRIADGKAEVERLATGAYPTRACQLAAIAAGSAECLGEVDSDGAKFELLGDKLGQFELATNDEFEPVQQDTDGALYYRNHSDSKMYRYKGGVQSNFPSPETNGQDLRWHVFADGNVMYQTNNTVTVYDADGLVKNLGNGNFFLWADGEVYVKQDAGWSKYKQAEGELELVHADSSLPSGFPSNNTTVFVSTSDGKTFGVDTTVDDTDLYRAYPTLGTLSNPLKKVAGMVAADEKLAMHGIDDNGNPALYLLDPTSGDATKITDKEIKNLTYAEGVISFSGTDFVGSVAVSNLSDVKIVATQSELKELKSVK